MPELPWNGGDALRRATVATAQSTAAAALEFRRNRLRAEMRSAIEPVERSTSSLRRRQTASSVTPWADVPHTRRPMMLTLQLSLRSDG